VSHMVRVGTCGSMRRSVRPGELVISSASVRDEGVSAQYLPREFPAVPDYTLLSRLVDGVRRREEAFHVGVTHCKDAYYAEEPETMPLGDELGRRWAAWRKAGVIATEMEAATLFVLAAVRGVRAGAILVPTDDTLSEEEAFGSLEVAAAVAAEALRETEKVDLEAVR